MRCVSQLHVSKYSPCKMRAIEVIFGNRQSNQIRSQLRDNLVLNSTMIHLQYQFSFSHHLMSLYWIPQELLPTIKWNRPLVLGVLLSWVNPKRLWVRYKNVIRNLLKRFISDMFVCFFRISSCGQRRLHSYKKRVTIGTESCKGLESEYPLTLCTLALSKVQST